MEWRGGEGRGGEGRGASHLSPDIHMVAPQLVLHAQNPLTAPGCVAVGHVAGDVRARRDSDRVHHDTGVGGKAGQGRV